MTMADRKEFDPSILPGTFKKDLREVIEVAVMVGWRVNVSKKQVVSLVSYDGQHSKTIGVSSTHRVNIHRLRREVLQHADPEKAMLAIAYYQGDATVRKAVAKAIPTVGDEGTVVEEPDEPEPEPDEPEPEDEPERPAPHIVSEKPMLASRGKGSGYHSRTTIERKWSDGTRDYRCAECDWTNADRLPVSRHFANVHAKGQGRTPLPPSFKADVAGAGYRPSKRRIEALAEVIEAMLEGGETDPTVLAETALTWVHEQSHHDTDLSAEHEPLSDSDILQRIRRLLDDGTMKATEQRIAALEDRLAEAEHQAEAAQAEAQRQAQRAEKARATLQAFTDLVSEVSAEEAG